MLGSKLARRRSMFDQEDANPMEGAINIVDAMLVFACGLMLSLVIYWNIDIQHTELTPADAGVEVSPSEASTMADETKDDANYEKMGTVYVDPDTGKMYLVEDAEEGADAGGVSESGSSGNGGESGA